MAPALLPGDLALVRREAPIHRGDIVLIRQQGHSAVLHRVARRRGDDAFVTRGDANPVDDLVPVTKADIAGRVVAVIPAGRLIARCREVR